MDRDGLAENADTQCIGYAPHEDLPPRSFGVRSSSSSLSNHPKNSLKYGTSGQAV